MAAGVLGTLVPRGCTLRACPCCKVWASFRRAYCSAGGTGSSQVVHKVSHANRDDIRADSHDRSAANQRGHANRGAQGCTPGNDAVGYVPVPASTGERPVRKPGTYDVEAARRGSTGYAVGV